MPCRNCLKRCVGISLNRNNGQMKWNHCHVLRFKEHSVENLSVIKCQIGRTFKQAKKRYKSKVTTEKALNQKLFNARIHTHHLLPCSSIPLKMTNKILYKSFIFFSPSLCSVGMSFLAFSIKMCFIGKRSFNTYFIRHKLAEWNS